MVLFSDSLLLAEQSKVSKLSSDLLQTPPMKFIELITLSANSLVEDYTSDKKMKGYPFVVTTATGPLILIAQTGEERASWVRILKSVVEGQLVVTLTQRFERFSGTTRSETEIGGDRSVSDGKDSGASLSHSALSQLVFQENESQICEFGNGVTFEPNGVCDLLGEFWSDEAEIQLQRMSKRCLSKLCRETTRRASHLLDV